MSTEPRNKIGLRQLLSLYRPRAGWLLLSTACLAITWLAAIGLLALSGWFITACALAGLGLLAGFNIFTPSAAIRTLAVVRTLGRYAERVIGHEAILRVLADLRVRGYDAMAGQVARGATAVQDSRHADRVTRLMADVDTLDAMPLRVLGPGLAGLATCLGAIGLAAWIGGWGAAGIVGLSGTLAFTAALSAALVGRHRGALLVETRSALRVRIDDHIRGLADLRACGRVQLHGLQVLEADLLLSHQLERQERLASWAEHAVQALTMLTALALLLWGWGRLEAPLLVLLVLLGLGLNEALASLPGALWRFGESEAAAGRLLHLEHDKHGANSEADSKPNSESNSESLGEPNSEADSKFHTEPTPEARLLQQACSLRLSQLVCSRGSQQALDLTVQPGIPLVLHGRSGVGKTALLQTLAGELKPRSGRLYCDLAGGGSEAQFLEATAARLASNLHPPSGLAQGGDQNSHGFEPNPGQVGYMAQADGLIDVSIRQYLSLGLVDTPDSRLWQVLESVELADLLRQTELGLDEPLGPRGSRLSGGQARRLQLAAWLLRDPAILLLDEPFRGLPVDQVQRLVARIRPWLESRCTIIVTHDPAALPQEWQCLEWPRGSTPHPSND